MHSNSLFSKTSIRTAGAVAEALTVLMWLRTIIAALSAERAMTKARNRALFVETLAVSQVGSTTAGGRSQKIKRQCYETESTKAGQSAPI